MKIVRLSVIALLSLMTSAIAWAGQPLSKLEIQQNFVGKTLVFSDGHRMSLSADGQYTITRSGVILEGDYQLPSGNILHLKWGPSIPQRTLFYKEGAKFYMIDRYGQRTDVVVVEKELTSDETTASINSPS